jgi:hypothetical protein
VNFSPAFKWFIALLLPLTLAWKLVPSVEFPEDSNNLKNKILEVLAQHQFAVTVTDDSVTLLTELPIIHATRGSCHMLVAKASPYGFDRDYIRHLDKNTADHMFFVFRGKIYAEQPTWLTAFNERWSTLLRKLGFAAHEPPVLAVVANTACDAEQLPWNEVRRGDPPTLK